MAKLFWAFFSSKETVSSCLPSELGFQSLTCPLWKIVQFVCTYNRKWIYCVLAWAWERETIISLILDTPFYHWRNDKYNLKITFIGKRSVQAEGKLFFSAVIPEPLLWCQPFLQVETLGICWPVVSQGSGRNSRHIVEESWIKRG